MTHFTGLARGARAALAAALVALVALVLAAVPAQAAGYRYWSFWEATDGAWGFATQGPATARPADGDVVGFRFAVSEDSANAKRPSTAPDFRRICGSVPEKAGSKRVAVVIDFGDARDAPSGETPPRPVVRVGCPQVRPQATAAEVLAEVAKPLRYDSNALLCGIAGYPAKGCGEQVAVSGPEHSAETGAAASASAAGASAAGGSAGSGGPSVGLVAGGAAVLLLGAAGVWQARRRRG